MTPVLKHSDAEEALAAATLKYGSTMAKNCVGTRYAWSIAPVIEIKSPTSDAAGNGLIALAVKEIFFSVPSDLSQNVEVIGVVALRECVALRVGLDVEVLF
jgi:hypothetical protein